MGELLHNDVRRAYADNEKECGDIWAHLNEAEPECDSRLVEVENEVTEVRENLVLHVEFEANMQEQMRDMKSQISEAHQAVKNWAQEVAQIGHQIGGLRKDFEGVQQESKGNVLAIAEINKKCSPQNPKFRNGDKKLPRNAPIWPRTMRNGHKNWKIWVVRLCTGWSRRWPLHRPPPGSVVVTQDPIQQAQLAGMRAEIEAMNKKNFDPGGDNHQTFGGEFVPPLLHALLHPWPWT